jgi:hypothetical protein
MILVKDGHGLENVRLNLFSVTISSVRTISLPPAFFYVTEPVSQNTSTQFVRHVQKSFGINAKCGKCSRKLILTFKRGIDIKLRQLFENP